MLLGGTHKLITQEFLIQENTVLFEQLDHWRDMFIYKAGTHGPVSIIVCVEDSAAIEKILKHLKGKAISTNTARLPAEMAPP
jgi:hypothetical protein